MIRNQIGTALEYKNQNCFDQYVRQIMNTQFCYGKKKKKTDRVITKLIVNKFGWRFLVTLMFPEIPI